MTPALKAAQKRYRARIVAEHQAGGRVRREVWAHPDDWEEIRELERALRERREHS